MFLLASRARPGVVIERRADVQVCAAIIQRVEIEMVDNQPLRAIRDESVKLNRPPPIRPTSGVPKGRLPRSLPGCAPVEFPNTFSVFFVDSGKLAPRKRNPKRLAVFVWNE